MGLFSWYRRRGLPVALVTCAVFLHTTLYANPVIAQAASAAAQATPPPQQDPPAPNASYDKSSQSDLSKHLADAAAPTAGGAADAANTPPESTDVQRALAGLPSGAGGVSAQAASLPTGAATQLGMGESFTMQLSTGSVGYSVPIVLPPARGRAQPNLALSYSSGAGFGVAGVGWSLGATALERQTDRGLPSYDDRASWHPNQDRFVFAGMELVPICTVAGGACAGALSGEVMPPWSNGWQYFRPRVEGAFMRFFWSPDHQTWRVQGKDGTNMELGVPLDASGYQGALERNPDLPAQIFRWYLARQYDTQVAAGGQPVNTVVYRYAADGNVPYLTDIFDTSPASAPTTTNLALYAHHTSIAYEPRPDTALSYRAGYQEFLERRVSGIDVTSKPFAAGGSALPRELVRRYHLGYDPTAHRSLLTSVAMEGRCASAVTENAAQSLPPTACPQLPAMAFEYQHVPGGGASLADSQGRAFDPFDTTVRDLGQSPPNSLDESDTGLLDVNGDGLPDVVVTAAGRFGGKHGLYLNGAASGAIGFGQLTTMSIVPTADVPDLGVLALHSPTIAALDIDSDGIVDLVHMPQANQYSVFSPAPDGAGGFQWVGRPVSTASQQNVKINFTQEAANVRVMDVNGDGLVDVVFDSATELQTFFSLGRFPGGDGQFGTAAMLSATSAQIANDPVVFCPPWSGTPVRLSDPDVQLADMNGDGLADIVRVRDGEVLYWPGRGNGFWGTGDPSGCGTQPFAVNRQIAMTGAPRFGTYDPGTLLLNDVNGDGLADLVIVRSQAVDIYLNDNAAGWTSVTSLTQVPFRPAGRSYVRLTDINGSGTPDILWGTAGDYKFIDLTGGITPGLLSTVHNGQGQTLELQYSTLASQMLAAAAAGQPWATFAPTAMPVLAQSTQRDHLDLVGGAAGAYVRQYTYRDPVFEGRQREFRGFSDVVVTNVGDGNSPTSHEHSVFQLGECSLQFSGTTPDVCTPPQRWQDNWREPLKGLPVLNETYDDNGVYDHTDHFTYELRQLYLGLDGRRVSAVFSVDKQHLAYDIALFDHQPGSIAMPEVLVNIPGIAHIESRPVTSRATAGTVHLLASTVYDNYGNVTDVIDTGCINGCPADESITTHSTFALPPGDSSGWLWREMRTYVVGSVSTALRHESVHTFDSFGNLATASNVLSGTLPLDRHHAAGAAIAPQPPAQSAGVTTAVQIVVEAPGYDGFGNSTSDKGASGHCSSRTYDADYAQLATVAKTFGGPADPTTGCGVNAFTHNVAYDRGLGQVVDSVDTRNQPSHFTYDGFGRLTSITGPDPSSPGKLAAQPTLTAAYQLPANGDTTPYSITDIHTQDGANPDTASYVETQIARDGMGRTLVKLQQADPTAGDGGAWVASGYVAYDAKGAVARTFDSVFYTGAIFGALTGPPAATPYRSQEYDAFGRASLSFGYDRNIALLVAHHPLSTDVYDAADVLPTVHQGTYTTAIVDGHGRAVQQITRIKVSGTLEARSLLFQYLPTGEVVSLIQRRAGSPDVVRWLKYDSLGRRVLNVEPNSAGGFNPDPTTDPNSIQAWRYAYDDAGDMVGFSDARGCGANYFYDTAGRLLAEDRSPCLATQDPYSAPNLTTGDGTEVFYRYDAADPDSSGVVDAAGHALSIDINELPGRVASVSSLGAKAIYQYDALGRGTGVGIRVQKPGSAATQLTSRYAPTWYVKTTGFDAADRPTSTTSGATVAALLGSNGASALTVSYTKRGAVNQYGSSYGILYASSVLLADGRPQSFTFGDTAATQRFFTYDANLRLSAVQTFRGTPSLWSSPPAGSPYVPPSATDDPTRQLLLEDRSLFYDEVGNLIRDEDHRLAGDWPGAAKPVTRTFEYDDLYRLTHTTYAYPGGLTDTWKSPFAAEDQTPAREQPAPRTAFTSRPTDQKFQYDFLGNLALGTDDSQAFWDRSTGNRTHGSAGMGPHQVLSASNRVLAPSSAFPGDLSAAYDVAGNLTGLIVRRDGACLPSGTSCWQRFAYEWNEVGFLTHGRRWDLGAASGERTANGQLSQALPARAPDAELRFAYDASGSRVLKTAFDPAGNQKHSLYVFSSLEVRSTAFNAASGDYTVDANTASVRLFAGPAVARIVVQPNLPSVTTGNQHVFLELADRIGSTTLLIDYATSELVEGTTYQTYGALESDYRPTRWGSEREPYKFGGKEEDIAVGLSYFGARYFSPYLATWISPDPVTIHDLGSDLNPYAYVHGTPLMGVDPDGRIFGIDDLLAVLIVIAVVAVVSAANNAVTQASEKGWGSVNWGMVALSGGIGGVSTAVSIGATALLGPAGVGLGAGVATALGGAVGSSTGYVLNQAANQQPITASGLALNVGTSLITAGAGSAFAGALGQNASALMRAGAAGFGASAAGAGMSAITSVSQGQAPSWNSLALSVCIGTATSVAMQFQPKFSGGGGARISSQQPEPEPGSGTMPNGEPLPPPVEPHPAPDPGSGAAPNQDVVYHYTTSDKGPSIQATGLWSQSSATDVGTYTPQEAVERLGVKTPPDVVVEIQNDGQFVPNKPAIVWPHALGSGGGLDLTNPVRVPPQCILCIRRIEK
jgi:RHS repeat-associated protein